MRHVLKHAGRGARRVGITIAGAIVVLAGVVMLVAPGPGILTIVLGLMILGTEYAFARRWVERIKAKTRQAVLYARERVGRGKRPPTPPDTT